MPNSWSEGEDLAKWRRLPLYGGFYGLVEAPFDLTPNPRFLFLAARHREALSNLRYALEASKGFTLVLGDAGTGKTTLVKAALEELGNRVSRWVLMQNPTMTKEEFFEFVAEGLGLGEEARRSKPRFLACLQDSVEQRLAAGGLTGLIVDEAQSLPHDLLEEIRLLGNIETPTTKLLNIIMCGQPELADRLNDVSLRQLKQRIALRCELKPLSLEETAAYVSARIRIAGGVPGHIFTREVVVAVFEASNGIPRTINVLCDNALIAGFAAQSKPITMDVVHEICRDFDLSRTAPEPKPMTAGARILASQLSAPAELPSPERARAEAGDPSPRAGQPRPREGASERPLFSSIGQESRGRFRFWR